MAQKNKAVGIRWVTKRELKQVLNARTQRVLGVSASTFQKEFASGKLSDKSVEGAAGTLELATLCSFTGGKKSARSISKRGRK